MASEQKVEHKTTVLIWKNYWTTGDCQSHPTFLFVFGDNVERWGTKGQATIRGCVNAMGIATKWKPSLDDDAFFSDDQYEDATRVIQDDIDAIKRALDAKKYETVVLPEDGLGTGLAELPQKAPKVFQFLQTELARLVGDL